VDITEKLIKPVRLEKMEFVGRLLSRHLHLSPEEVCDELDWRDGIESVEFLELQEKPSDAAVKSLEPEPAEIDPDDWDEMHPGTKALMLGLVDDLPPEAYKDDFGSDDETEGFNPFDPRRIDPEYLPDDIDDRDPPETYPLRHGDTANADDDQDEDGQPADDEQGEEEQAEDEQGEDEQDEDEQAEDDDTGGLFSDDDEFGVGRDTDGSATIGMSSVKDNSDEEKIPVQFDYEEVSGTALVDPATALLPHIGGDDADDIEYGDADDKQTLPPVADPTLDQPAVGPNGEYIYARPDAKYMVPKATRWYGQEETIGDWMTTLKTATESNPEYEDGGDEDTDIESPETVETLFETLENAAVPTAYQVVFQARDDWSDAAQQRKRNIRSGDFDQPWLEKYVLNGYEPDEDRDLKAYEYRRIKLIENKRPKKTFNANVRALSLLPHDEFTTDPESPVPLVDGDSAAAEEAVGELKPLFDPLDGVYYHVVGDRAPKSGASGTDLTAREVAENFLAHDLVTREDRRGWLTKFNLWNDPKKRPELILNADELSDFITVPSGEELGGDAYRSAGTTDEDADHLRRPRPEIHRKLTGGMDIGYAFDEDGVPEDEPTSIPVNKLTNHWLKVGSSGSGKTINTIGMGLSLHANVDGPVIFVDPKNGDMIENYAKAHAAKFGDLRDVQIFEVPKVLPAIPFFDIRPHLYEGMNRDNAIQQKVDEFHLIMQMIDDNYETAYVAKSVLGALIKSQFDARHGADSFTLDDLYDTAVEMYSDQTVPRVSHQPQVRNILTNQLNNAEQDFKNTMQAVINRLDDLQEDINLYRLFNQNPAWDDDKGEYKYNRVTQAEYEEAKESDKKQDPEPPYTALDFRELLDSNKVVLFDTGGFVGDESQRAFSMYILSALWSAVKSRYNDRKSHETIDNTASLIIEEAAPIVSTELVTNTLIPEGREFGLSLGMVMQFPEQVRKHSDAETYNEIITNVQSKIIGQIEPGQRIIESLVHGDRDKEAIKNKVSLLSGGEWIADLPEPEFGADVPPPFSVKSLGIPPGHPEGDKPFNHDGREKFYRQYKQRKNRVAKKHGYIQPSAEEIAEADSPGDALGFQGGEEDDEDTATPSVPDASGDSHEDADGEQSAGGLMDTSDDSGSTGEVALGTTPGDSATEENGAAAGAATADDSGSFAGDEQAKETTAETSADGGATTEVDAGSEGSADDGPDFGSYAPLARDALEDICGKVAPDDGGELANIAQELWSELGEDDYYRSMLTLSQIAAAEGMTFKPRELHASVQQQATGDKPDAETTAQIDEPTGEATPHASDVDEDNGEDSDGDNGEDSGSQADAETADATGDEDKGSSDTAASGADTGEGSGDENPADDVPKSDDGSDTIEVSQRIDDIDKNALQANGDTPTEDMFAGNDPDDDDEQAENNTQKSSEERAKETGENNEQPDEPAYIEGLIDSTAEDIDLTVTENSPEDNAEVDDDAGAEGENEDVSISTPMPPAYGDFNLDQYDDREFSDDDKQFLSLLDSAFHDDLDWYSLTDSMTELRDHAGEPDIEGMIECGYIDDGKIGNRKYYSLTRKGWRAIGESVPGNEFGDHMEKMEHRVGVYLLAEHIGKREGVAYAEEYARYEGETYDVIGWDPFGAVAVAGEAETESNNPTAVAEDYKKLSQIPGDVIWAHPSERACASIWEMVNQSVLNETLPARATERTYRLEDYANNHDLAGIDFVRTYSKLEDDEG
ncbi:hypothetical protein C435_14098, partial [Haloarcula marismortui ATCC 33799]